MKILNFNLKTFMAGAAAVLCCVALSSCGQQEANTLTKQEIADGWQLLFNGENLDGWRVYNSDQQSQDWHVVDGCIQAKGEDASDLSGYLVTEKEYENFILDWDWKLTFGGNSGMLYHVYEDPFFEVPYVTGPEYQLIDNEGWNERYAPSQLADWQKLGVDYAMHLPDENAIHANPVGEWNNSRIVYDNGHVEHWLNGHKILEFEAFTDDWYARKGSGKWADAPEYGIARSGVICLQDHGDPASFRNIKIKELPRKAGEEIELFNGVDLSGWDVFGTENWYVDEDGNIVAESGPDKGFGYLATPVYYEDFDLTVEFNELVSGNYGLFFHCIVKPGQRIYGMECDVLPKESGNTASIYEVGGRGFLTPIPEDKADVLKEGEWNTLRLRVEGGHIQTWLNGEQMVDLNDPETCRFKGRIALQIGSGDGLKIAWRNIQFKTL